MTRTALAPTGDLDAFLSSRGASRSAVVSAIDVTFARHQEDEVLAVGSVVEGLGTSKSDLDVLVIVESGSTEAMTSRSSALVVGRCLVDAVVMSSTYVAELVDRLHVWAERPWDVSTAAPFTLAERTLLHRLVYRVELASPESADRIPVPDRFELARLKHQIARQAARTIQVDLVGYRQSEDYASLGYATQELLGHALDSLLSGHHITNPLGKWRSRLADRLPADWETPLGGWSSGMTASARIWQLHRAPDVPDRIASSAHASRAAAFARSAFLWAETTLFARASIAAAAHRPTSDRGLRREVLPSLELDVDYAFDGASISVARLNEFGERLDLDASELAALMFFDGESTVIEAASAVYGSQSSQRGLEAVDALAIRVARAGLTVS